MTELKHRATVVSFRGRVLRVYDHTEPDLEPGWLFVLMFRYREVEAETSAKLLLWPADLIRPVRDAIAAGRDVDMRGYKRAEKVRRAHERELRKVIVEPGDDADALAAELGIV